MAVILFRTIYTLDIVNNTRSDEPRTSKGVSSIVLEYVIHSADDTILMMQNKREYVLRDLLV
jgi:hypothetical protein